MRILALVVFLALAAAPAGAQRQAPTINTETPEGQLLQQVGEEADDAKKVALMEQFIAKYPSHEGAAWVYSLMVPSYTKTGQFDKAMAAAEKALGADPTDLQTALAVLKAAEAKKDPEAVRVWAVKASDHARRVLAAPKSADEDEDEYKRRAEFAKQLDTYADYSLYAAALQTPDPKQKADLFRVLEERSPNSQYAAQAVGPYLLALSQAGDMPAAAAVAEAAIAKDAATEEIFAFLGDYYLRQNKEFDKVLAYSAKLIELVNSRPKPEGISDADWLKRKDQLLGLGYWMTGAVQSLQNKYADADKSLRAALPHLEGNEDLKSGALFHLGVANYKLTNIADAIKFTEQCATMKGPYQAQAAKNLKAIRSEYRVVR